MTKYCPRGAGPGSPYKPPFDGSMTWLDDGTCSYCGSLSQEKFFAAIEAGCEVGPTDKSYKVYVNGDAAPSVRGACKFYLQHLDEAGMHRFIEMANNKTMKIGFPGHFYVQPYFCGPA